MSGSREAREIADGFLTRAGRGRTGCGQRRIGLLIIALPMGLMRSAFLAGSQSRWLRERAVKYRFVHRAVSRFMPGEDLNAALAAANDLKPKGIGSVLTYLGENVKDLGEAQQVARHYLEVLARSKEAANRGNDVVRRRTRSLREVEKAVQAGVTPGAIHGGFRASGN